MEVAQKLHDGQHHSRIRIDFFYTLRPLCLFFLFSSKLSFLLPSSSHHTLYASLCAVYSSSCSWRCFPSLSPSPSPVPPVRSSKHQSLAASLDRALMCNSSAMVRNRTLLAPPLLSEALVRVLGPTIATSGNGTGPLRLHTRRYPKSTAIPSKRAYSRRSRCAVGLSLRVAINRLTRTSHPAATLIKSDVNAVLQEFTNLPDYVNNLLKTALSKTLNQVNLKQTPEVSLELVGSLRPLANPVYVCTTQEQLAVISKSVNDAIEKIEKCVHRIAFNSALS